MKNVIASILLGACLAACASTQSSGSKDVAEADSSAKTKRVCETVRTNQTGQRLRRVCREVPVTEAEEKS